MPKQADFFTLALTTRKNLKRTTHFTYFYELMKENVPQRWALIERNIHCRTIRGVEPFKKWMIYANVFVFQLLNEMIRWSDVLDKSCRAIITFAHRHTGNKIVVRRFLSNTNYYIYRNINHHSNNSGWQIQTFKVNSHENSDI